MNTADTRIVFMGTPPFAVASLDALVKAGFTISAVVTAPDKPAGRGLQLQESAVKKYAVENNLPVLQPVKLKDPAFISALEALNANVFVVVAFRMLPEIVWNMPPMGTINVHGSLLPSYRGAAPINWAVINGEKETGVTTFKLKAAIDTGNILLQDKLPITDADTAGTIHDKMMVLGANLLVTTLHGIINNTLLEKDQEDIINNDPNLLKHAPKIFTETCTINWNNTAESIFNLIRGLSPFPGALTKLDDKIFKIFAAQKEICKHQSPAGSVLTDNKTYLKFACADGYLHITDLQLEGKKRMQVADFLRGYNIKSAQ
ncbi:MAG: methionyl-tRNA formyltransferase [Sediminibacterium sp.]